jgi:hypothetical protein
MENGKMTKMFAPIRVLKKQKTVYHVQLDAQSAVHLTSVILVGRIIHLLKDIILDTAWLTVRKEGTTRLCILMIKASAKKQAYNPDLEILHRD